MKKIFLCLIIINLLFFFNIYGKPTPVAVVKLIKGEAFFKLKSDNQFIKLTINQELAENSIVKTSAKSAITLKLKNDSLIELKEGSQIIINKELLKRSSASLIQGKAKFKIEKLLRQERFFNIYTPTAVVGVRGTEYELGIADDGSTAVNVNNGEVIVNNGKNEMSVVKNQSAEVTIDNPKISRTEKPLDMNNWDKVKNDEIEKQAAAKMKAIDYILNSTFNDQKKALSGMSGLQPSDRQQADKNIDSALFNQCKTEGLMAAAEKIKSNNKDNSQVQASYKKIEGSYKRLDALNKMIDEKFNSMDTIFDVKEIKLDKKIDDFQKKFEEKFKFK